MTTPNQQVEEIAEQLSRVGAVHQAGLISEQAVAQLCTILAPLPLERPGIRLQGVKELAKLLDGEGLVGRLAVEILGPAARPVRALLFDKSASANWKLGWHQDRVIAVKTYCDVSGFGPWSKKGGVIHVAPPVEILASMLTIRLHLDDVDEENAPLLVAPGSHRFGMIREPDIAAAVSDCGVLCCCAAAGDAWIYSTLILHASDSAVRPRRRRVLQVDYSATDLPGGLEWAGITCDSPFG